MTFVRRRPQKPGRMTFVRRRPQKLGAFTPSAVAYSADARRQLVQDLCKHYATEAFSYSPFVVEQTDTHRRRLWASWQMFCGDDPVRYEQAWLPLIERPNIPENLAPFLAFLEYTVRTSVHTKAVLDERETVTAYSIGSVHSVKQLWRNLTAAADAFFLRRYRGEGPGRQHLQIQTGTHDKKMEGCSYLVVQWIFGDLAPKFNLDMIPTYEKVEMTMPDVVAFFLTLWTRANDIPCGRLLRSAFHSDVLLSAITGARPGQLLYMTYSDFDIFAMRDTQDPSKTTLGMTVRIHRNKIKKRAVITPSRAKFSFKFDITFIPNSCLCFLSQVIARAIQDNAFASNFRSIDDILSRPKLDGVNAVPLRWKPEIEDQVVFPISYSSLNRLWHRTLLVHGCRNRTRLYSLRVGAGGRLDGVLTSALRSFVLGNTPNVFNNSYQPERMRENLAKLSLGSKFYRQNDDELFQRMRELSCNRDPGAPCDITKDEYAKFEKRRDITGFRATLQNPNSSDEEKREANSMLRSRLKRLEMLQLEKNREEYFKAADERRTSTGSGGDVARIPSTPSTAESGISEHLAVSLNSSSFDISVHARPFVSLLVDYLRGEHGGNAKVQKGNGKPETVKKEDRKRAPDDTPLDLGRCLLCDDRPLFSCKSSLTRHYRAVHFAEDFDQPFLCPECHRQERADITISDGTEWSNHVATTHGEQHAPKPPREHPSQCPSCTTEALSLEKLARHVRCHLSERPDHWPLPCLACERSGLSDVVLTNKWHWIDHARKHLPKLVSCRLCGRHCASDAGLVRHMTVSHAEDLQQPLFCPACQHIESKQSPILGLFEWSLHLKMVHGDSGLESWAAKLSPEGKRKAATAETPTEALASEREGKRRKVGPEATHCVDPEPASSTASSPNVTSGDMDRSARDSASTSRSASPSLDTVRTPASPRVPPPCESRTKHDGGSYPEPASWRDARPAGAATPPTELGLGDGPGEEHTGECLTPGQDSFDPPPPYSPMSVLGLEGAEEYREPIVRKPGYDRPGSAAPPPSRSASLSPPPTVTTASAAPAHMIDPALRDPSACEGRGGAADLGATRAADAETATTGSSGDADITEPDQYRVELVLQQYKSLYYLLWADGSYSWEPRKNIHPGLIVDFESSGTDRRLRRGVQLLGPTRVKQGKLEYQAQLQGRPTKNWISEQDIGVELLDAWLQQKVV